ncbi:hypothetical protein [Leptospira sarikeiensis]|uniref:DUF4136 domain-containing protein n=1 Tax=Leptospira sarikeiensis TaxID=2484943 RepID=A0A4R9KBV0_9LEPT|nr:hypothetical protein [Leptospira sarikeiensis]TGL63345.1 hypothetical protein EHQ64_05130 [Leptospira sarikeiensis]
MRILILIFLSGLISCSPLQVKSQVEVERSEFMRYQGKTYAFLPFFGQAPKVIIIENAELIREKFAEKGYEEVHFEKADILVHYDILIMPRGSMIDFRTDLGAFGGWTTARGMRYHSWGGSSSRSNSVSLLGFMGYAGSFGYGGGYRSGGYAPYAENFYDVIFKIEMYDGKKYRGLPSSLLLKANVEGEGRSGPLFDVVPYLITSFFKTFPELKGEKKVIVSEDEVWKGD